MCSYLVESANKHNWKIELFPGFDGRNHRFPYKIDERYPKGAEQFQRAGVRGCFMSHYALWRRCLELNEPIGIFESDVIFRKAPPSSLKDCDAIKLHGFKISKPAATGNWHQGSHAYILKPSGAQKMIAWTELYGASPADYMLGDKVITMKYDFEDRVKLVKSDTSLTWNLEEEML